ncbi:MAG: LPS export ABC transporter permease LptF [Desulfarculaceae bacterium]|jgi:lipopolysaccharide export system permease protein
MLRPAIIHKYLFKEMLAPFFLSMAVATFTLLLAKIIELTDLVVRRGVGLDVVGKLLIYGLPYFFVFTVPMATLLGVLLAFMRLSSDNEITALKSAGVSLGRLLPPVAFLALLAWGATQILTVWALPWGHNQFENLLFQVARSRADLALKERTFLDSFKGMTIYINRLPGQGIMLDLFIVDKRDPKQVYTVVAKRGKLFPARKGKMTLRLFEGTIHRVGPGYKSAQNAKFDVYDVKLDTTRLGPGKRTSKHRKEMYMDELWAAMSKAKDGTREYDQLDMEMQQRFAYPFSCLVMALIGLPLGTHWRSGRSWGVITALAVFLVYYLLLSMAWSLGDTGFYPPKLGIWLPNLVFTVVGVLLFRSELKETPLPVLDNLGNLPALLTRRRRRQLKAAT